MISARRLAREWALKILYQADVAKMPIEESRTVALERLRNEFVQRASRSATGSQLEERLTDAVTANLFDVLELFDPPFEAGLHACFAQLAHAAEYWSALDIPFTFARQSYNALWDLPKRSADVALPVEYGALPASLLNTDTLSDDARQRLIRFLGWARFGLSEVAMRAYARETQLGRPEGANLAATHEYAEARWSVFSTSTAERWEPALMAAEKQTLDWMRVAAFTLNLVSGVHDNREALDRSLQGLEIGWSLERQVSVDRNILRMAAFELEHVDSIPASATINEAVELAKKYSTAESGKFVNGVLGAIVARRGATEAAYPRQAAPKDAAIDAADVSLVGDGDVVLDEAANDEELAGV